MLAVRQIRAASRSQTASHLRWLWRRRSRQHNDDYSNSGNIMTTETTTSTFFSRRMIIILFLHSHLNRKEFERKGNSWLYYFTLSGSIIVPNHPYNYYTVAPIFFFLSVNAIWYSFDMYERSVYVCICARRAIFFSFFVDCLCKFSCAHPMIAYWSKEKTWNFFRYFVAHCQ